MILFFVTIVLGAITVIDVSDRIRFSIKNEKLKTIIYLGFIVGSFIEFIREIQFFAKLLF
jgi:uncharacterized membrane protein YheB (UPF0754 family)